MTDRTQGPLLTDVRPGDVLVADSGFTCIQAGASLTVAQGDDGKMYVPCNSDGQTRDGQPMKHLLSGQTDDTGHLIGLTRSP